MEKEILKQFLYNEKLKFNELEKNSKIRSNKLAYHIKKLTEKGIVIKENDFYRLSENSENIIPYLSEKKSVLPVILIIIKRKNKIFLYKRDKRPYKNLLGLPGGRILLGETIEKATERIMKIGFKIKCKFNRINSVSLESVKKNNQTIHSFLLILVTATTKEKINYTYIKKKNMIKSDYKLTKEDLNSKVKIKNIVSKI